MIIKLLADHDLKETHPDLTKTLKLTPLFDRQTY